MLNGADHLETTEFMASRIDKFGTPEAYNHYAVGWAHAMDTPYQWTKQVASHWGGTRNGTIVRWPNGIKAKGEIRHQFHHVIDVAPDRPRGRRPARPDLRQRHPAGAARGRLDGLLLRRRRAPRTATRPSTSRCSSTAASTTRAGRRSPATPSRGTRRPARQPIDDDVWELYGPDDWTQARDLAAEQPEQLAHLQRLFLIEAGKYNVLPLDDRRVERFNADLAGRPQLIQGNTQILFGGMGRLSENSLLVLKNKSHAVTAEVVVPEGGASGTIVAQGGAFGGWSLYLTEGKPAYCYNLFGLQQFKVYGSDAVPGRRAPGPGRVHLRRRRARQGRHRRALRRRREGRRGPGRRDRADGLLGRRDDRCRQRHRHAGDRRPRRGQAAFTGRVKWVQLDLGEDAEDADHLISPEERYRIAMARQ